MLLFPFPFFTCCDLTGKTTFFVANQANLEDMPAEKLAGMEAEYKEVDEANKALQAEVRSATAGDCMLLIHYPYSCLLVDHDQNLRRSRTRLQT